MNEARRLFLDQHSIGSMRNVVRTFHPATKHPAGPVLVPDRPWERSMGHSSGTILYQDGQPVFVHHYVIGGRYRRLDCW